MLATATSATLQAEASSTAGGTPRQRRRDRCLVARAPKNEGTNAIRALR